MIPCMKCSGLPIDYMNVMEMTSGQLITLFKEEVCRFMHKSVITADFLDDVRFKLKCYFLLSLIQ